MKTLLNKIKNALPFFKNKKLDKPIKFNHVAEDIHNAWWGTIEVLPEQSRYAKIDGVVICVDHYNQEWHIAHYREGQNKPQSKTIATQIGQTQIALKPTMPDRSVFLTLENALLLPPKSQMTFYINTPVFIRINIGNPPILLDEVPTEILSDTWFGKNTQSGELGYSSSHLVAHQLEDLFKDNTHAITPINVRNQFLENVLLKEIKIPAPYLSLFCDQQNHLWTEEITLDFLSHEMTNLHIEKGPPEGLKESLLLSLPRHNMKTSFISLFNPL